MVQYYKLHIYLKRISFSTVQENTNSAGLSFSNLPNLSKNSKDRLVFRTGS